MFGSNNKFDPNKDIPDLSGKVYVVTGGSAGLGYGICAHILQHNPEKLYLLGNKTEHLEEASEALKKFGDVSKIELVQTNLADLHQTHQTALSLASRLTRLDALVLNAGIGVGPYNTTTDGIDSHMQINVISQHHLAMHLLPLLTKTSDSRVVLQSSEFHRLGTGGVEFQDLAELNQDIGPHKLYARSKLAQICLVKALSRRKAAGQLGLTAGQPPWINATHPGGVSTDQPEQAVEAYGKLGKLGVAAARPFLKDPVDEGCRPALFAACAEHIGKEGIDGAYLVPDCKVTEVSKQAQDEGLQERCLALVGGLLKEKLGGLGYEMD